MNKKEFDKRSLEIRDFVYEIARDVLEKVQNDPLGLSPKQRWFVLARVVGILHSKVYNFGLMNECEAAALKSEEGE